MLVPPPEGPQAAQVGPLRSPISLLSHDLSWRGRPVSDRRGTTQGADRIAILRTGLPQAGLVEGRWSDTSNRTVLDRADRGTLERYPARDCPRQDRPGDAGEYRAWGAGRWAQGAGRWAQGAGRRARGTGRRAEGAGRRAQDGGGLKASRGHARISRPLSRLSRSAARRCCVPLPLRLLRDPLPKRLHQDPSTRRCCTRWR